MLSPAAAFARLAALMTKAKNKQYNAESIQLLVGLEPIQKRPGMYTDTANPDHLVQEVVDNSVDEAMAGFAKTIQVSLSEDTAIEVIDDGRGMPANVHPKHGISGIELVLTRLHAGGKFNNDNYNHAGGLHGVGISLVNALSSRLEVGVRRDGKLYEMAFAEGAPLSELRATDKVSPKNTGTRIKFWPNPRYFDSVRLNLPKLTHLLRAKAVLCPGLKLQLRVETKGKWEQQCWQYSAGIGSYLAEAVAGQELFPVEPFCYAALAGEEQVEWAMQWCLDLDNKPVTESYVNLIPTPQGGTHVNSLRSGILAALHEFCEFRNLLPKGIKLTPEDIWKNCCYILSVKLQEPQFYGQTKERLVSRRPVAFVSAIAKDSFSLWLNQHTSDATHLAGLVIAKAQSRARLARKVERKKAVAGPALPGKLADCVSQDVTRTEIFLVEGDSAGGSAKQARDREYQAVMPLRGKIVNAWEISSAAALESQEINNIAVALGISPGSPDLSDLRYGKVCILADADSDGLHIATLLCALFLQHFPALVQAGHLHVAMSPLYRINVGKEVFYALDDADKQDILKRVAADNKQRQVSVQRFKGLGEMNPLQLRDTTMAPGTRRLVQLTLDSIAETKEDMDMLLAKKRAADRRLWLETPMALEENDGALEA